MEIQKIIIEKDSLKLELNKLYENEKKIIMKYKNKEKIMYVDNCVLEVNLLILTGLGEEKVNFYYENDNKKREKLYYTGIKENNFLYKDYPITNGLINVFVKEDKSLQVNIYNDLKFSYVSFEISNDSILYGSFTVNKDNLLYINMKNRHNNIQQKIHFSNNIEKKIEFALDLNEFQLYGYWDFYTVSIENNKLVKKQIIFEDNEMLTILESDDKQLMKNYKVYTTASGTLALRISDFKDEIEVSNVECKEDYFELTVDNYDRAHISYFVLKDRTTGKEYYYYPTKNNNTLIFKINNISELNLSLYNLYLEQLIDGSLYRYRVGAKSSKEIALPTMKYTKDNIQYETSFYYTIDKDVSFFNKKIVPKAQMTKFEDNMSQIKVLIKANFTVANVFLRHRNTGIKKMLSFSTNEIDKEIEVLYLSEQTYKYLGVWDYYVETEDRKNIRVESEMESNTILSDSLKLNEDNFCTMNRMYVTQDKQLALLIYEPEMLVNFIDVKDSNLIINLESENKTLLTIFKNTNLNLGLLSEDMKVDELDSSIINKDNKTSIIAKFSKFTPRKLGYFNQNKVILIIKAHGKIYYLGITNVMDKYTSSSYKIFPEFSISNKYCIKPEFERNNLVLYTLPQITIKITNFSTDSVTLYSENLKKNDRVYLGLYKNNNIQKLTNSISYLDGNVLNIPLEIVLDKDGIIQTNTFEQVVCFIERDDKLFNLSLEITPKVSEKMNFSITSKMNDENIVLFYRRRARKLSVRYEISNEVFDWKYKIKINSAKILAKLLPKKNEHWIVGENLGYSAQDNGMMFFKSAVEKKITENVKFVYRPEYLATAGVKKMKGMIKYDSYSHLLAYFRCDLLIVSHGIRDVMPTYYHNNLKKNTKELIYLQHGIVAMKKIFFHSKSYNGKIRKMVTSSRNETGIFMKEMKFKKNQMLESGLIRYDYLEDTSKKEQEKIIFVMPTWREWLISDKREFMNSDFYKYYSELLQDERLNDYLIANNMRIKMVPHIEIKMKYHDLFKADLSNIEFVDTSKESIQDLIKKSSLMITDYSSVAFDFSYLNKPVIFYQFDLPDYLYNRGSFIDLYTELLGERVENYKDLKTEIELKIKNGFDIDEKYTSRMSKYFGHRDRHNFDRTYDGIKKMKTGGNK